MQVTGRWRRIRPELGREALPERLINKQRPRVLAARRDRRHVQAVRRLVQAVGCDRRLGVTRGLFRVAGRQGRLRRCQPRSPQLRAEPLARDVRPVRVRLVRDRHPIAEQLGRPARGSQRNGGGGSELALRLIAQARRDIQID